MSLISSIASGLGLHHAAAAPAAAAAAPAPPAANIAHVQILSINDLHGQLGDSSAEVEGTKIGGAATLAAYVNRERATNPSGTVFVSAGDAVGASPPESTLLKHHSTIAVLGAMGLDLATFGNHEFDQGFAQAIGLIFGDDAIPAAQRAQGIPVTPVPGARRRRRPNGGIAGARAGASHVAAAKGKPAWPGSPFPWINANVVDKRTGKSILPPYVIKTVNGVKVAFIGATTKDLKKVTMAKGIPNIEAIDPATAINKLIPEIKAKGAQTMVVVVHEGGEADKSDPKKINGAIVELAEKLDPAVDAIVSGHSHKEYATTIAGKQVVQAGNYAKALGVISLDVDRTTGDVVAASSRLVRNDETGIAPDPLVNTMVTRFQAIVKPRTSKVITKIDAPLTRTPSNSGETTLGSVIADAQRAFAKTDVALMNPGGVRQDLPTAGNITWGDLFGVQPFGNIVTKLEITGADLRAALEQQFNDKGEAKVLQISGMTVHMDLTKPIGQRIVSVTMADGSPLDPAKTYSVAANSFIADGGDGFTALKKAKKKTEVGDDLSALVQYMAHGGKVATTPPGRIVLDAGSLPEAH